MDPESPYKFIIAYCENRFDIPKGFEDVAKYNGTLGHKANHNFNENVINSYVRQTLNSFYSWVHLKIASHVSIIT